MTIRRQFQGRLLSGRGRAALSLGGALFIFAVACGLYLTVAAHV